MLSAFDILAILEVASPFCFSLEEDAELLVELFALRPLEPEEVDAEEVPLLLMPLLVVVSLFEVAAAAKVAVAEVEDDEAELTSVALAVRARLWRSRSRRSSLMLFSCAGWCSDVQTAGVKVSSCCRLRC